MQFTTRQVVIMIGSVVVTGLLVFIIINNIKPKGDDLPGGGKKDTVINVWGVDSSSAFSQVSEDFEKLRPGVDVNYKQFKEETFENELLSALAAGIGPDVIMVKNRSLSRLQNKLLPLNQNQVSITRFRQLFPTVTEQDFIDNKNSLIYALPLYVDTLAFLYDRDAFDKAGILSFPTTWEKLSQDAIKLRELSPNGQLVKSSVALGGSNRTVINGSDLLVLLMMQHGANFNQGTIRADVASSNALNFYLQFSNPASPFYSWSETFGSSFDSFIGHKTSIIPIYFGQLSKLLEKDPFLRYQVAGMAQLKTDSPVNYADYWGLTVIRQSKEPVLAWDFAQYVTIQPINAAAYAQKTSRPPALKVLLEANFSDPIKGIFARQALTARSWSGPNDFTVRQIISNSILAFMRGEVDMTTALDTIELQIKQVSALK